MSSNESNFSTAAESTDSDANLSPGQQLVRARENAGLSQDELAARLCMTVTKLDYLEQDEYERLAGVTYVRGYIRNVCKQLKLDPAPVVAAFDARLPAESEQLAMPPKGPIVGGGSSRSGGIGFAPVALAALIAAGGGYWWYVEGQPGVQQFTQTATPTVAAEESPANAEPFTTAAAPAVENSADFEGAEQGAGNESLSSEPDLAAAPEPAPDMQRADEAMVDQADPAVEEEVVAAAEEPSLAEAVAAAPVVPLVDPESRVSVSESAPASATEQEAGTQTEATALASSADLALAFSEESWVEVTDAQGNKLLARLQPAGSSVELSGEAPFQLMLGNAAATTVSYEGEVVDSAPLGNRRTRKLTVGG